MTAGICVTLRRHSGASVHAVPVGAGRELASSRESSGGGRERLGIEQGIQWWEQGENWH